MWVHDLRHSAATIVIAAGVHPEMVQERMVNSGTAMTMDIYLRVVI